MSQDPTPSGSLAAPSLASRFGLVRLGAGIVLGVVAALQPASAGFRYDAAVYWSGSTALVDGGDVGERGMLALRGVLTSVLYLPAAAVAQVGGEAAGRVAVLAQNALLVAVIGVVLVPRLVGVWRPVNVRVVIASAVLTGLLLRGFAPFPLSDLWAAALLLLVVAALDQRTPPWLVVAGVAAGAAVNIRPATLVPLAAVGLAVLVARRWSVGWVLLGGAVALAPQLVFNVVRTGTWLPVPARTAELSELQASYAAYVIRYDTVMSASAADPRLFWCSPGMARALDGRPPSSPGELVGTFLGHLPQSLGFAAQKVGAALHWPVATPYTDPAPGVDALVAVLVTGVTVVGLAALLRLALRRGRALSAGQAASTLVWLGSAAGLITSATETRFALPLVLCGVAGCAALVAQGLGVDRLRQRRAWVAGTVFVVVAVYAVGVTGLQNPVEGPVTVSTCADS